MKYASTAISHEFSYQVWLLSNQEVFRLVVKNRQMHVDCNGGNEGSGHSHFLPCDGGCHDRHHGGGGFAEFCAIGITLASCLNRPDWLLSGWPLSRSPFGLKTIFPLG